MSGPVLHAGMAFWLARVRSHLYVVLNDPEPPQNEVVIANLVTWKDNHRDPVLFRATDHPFIHCNTTVSPAHARRGPAAKLIAAGINFHGTPFTPSQVQRIRQALLSSDQTSAQVKDLLRRL